MGETDPSLIAFCEKELPKLTGSLTLYCGDPVLGEEFAQEALARLCLRWSRVRGMASPEAWVHRVAINLANSVFRRRLVERRAKHSLSTSTVVDDPDSATAVAIRDAVSRLPRRQKTALVLRYYADLTVEDVAQLMECPPSTVKTLTRRAIQRLESQFAKEVRRV
jgi:RNA polymerase sigma-70 factor (ECF subfamily)